MSGRAIELIDLAIAALDRYEDPFHESFLREHNVTLDEACDLSDAMSAGLTMVRAFSASPSGERVDRRRVSPEVATEEAQK